MGVRLVLRSRRAREGEDEPLRYEFAGPRVLIGRRSDADIELPHPAVSATHATVRAQGPRFVLVDEGSTNGTKVNGTRLPPGRPKSLRSGDRIDVGVFELLVELGPTGEGTSAERTAAFARRLLRQALAGMDDAPEPPTLVVMHGPSAGQKLILPAAPARLVLGRDETCDLTLPDGDCSREHAEVVHDLDGVLLRDLGSKNGTFRNGHELREGRLKDRDELRLGATFLSFEDEAEARRRELHGQEDSPLGEPPAMEGRPTAPEAPAPNPAGGAPGPAEGARDEGPKDREPEPEEPDSAAPARVDLRQGTVPQAPGAPRSLRARPRRAASADLVLYLLAGAVLAISLAGLVWLLRY
ncbi:MAG: FHA domain-containing protein [Myxococcota bacterium]